MVKEVLTDTVLQYLQSEDPKKRLLGEYVELFRRNRKLHRYLFTNGFVMDPATDGEDFQILINEFFTQVSMLQILRQRISNLNVREDLKALLEELREERKQEQEI